MILLFYWDRTLFVDRDVNFSFRVGVSVTCLYIVEKITILGLI